MKRLFSGLLVSSLLHAGIFGVALGLIAWRQAFAMHTMDIDMSTPLLTLEARPTPPPEIWIEAKKGKAPPPLLKPKPTPEPVAMATASRQPSWEGGLIGDDDYPTEMRKQKKEGKVIVELLINTDGKVGGVSLIRGDDPAFNAVVLDRLKDAKFRPALDKLGQPMNCRVRVPISFKLQ